MSRNDIINTDGTIKWDTVGGFKDSIDTHASQLADIVTNAVREFGADPTGTNDSTTAIQNAINFVANQKFGTNQGGIVYLPGSFIVSSALTIPSNVKIKGLSKYASLISNTTSNSTFTNTGTQSNIAIEDISIVGNKQGTSQCHINLNNITNLIIRDCVLSQAAAANIQIQNSNGIVVENNLLENSGWNGSWGGGVVFSNCYNIKVEKNTSSNNGGLGIDLTGGCYDFSIINNTCLSNQQGGISMTEYCYNGTVIGNICNNNGSAANGTNDGINGHQLNNVIIKGNICRGNSFNGIAIDGTDGSSNTSAYNVIVSENECHENGANGIYLYYANTCKLVANIAMNNNKSDNGYNGIKLIGATYNQILDNSSFDNGGTYRVDDISLDASSSNNYIDGNSVGNVSSSWTTYANGITINSQNNYIGAIDYTRFVFSGTHSPINVTSSYRTSQKYSDELVKVYESIEFTLSNATSQTDVLAELQENARVLSVEIIYTEATSSNTGTAVNIGNPPGNGLNYVATFTTEVSKALWSITSATINAGNILLGKGSLLTVQSVNGKTGTGKIKVRVRVMTPPYYV